MNQLVLIVLLLFADDSTLVKAAKANGGLKKPIPKKTITNKDVKGSKGKIVELPSKDGAPALQGTIGKSSSRCSSSRFKRSCSGRARAIARCFLIATAVYRRWAVHGVASIEHRESNFSKMSAAGGELCEIVGRRMRSL